MVSRNGSHLCEGQRSAACGDPLSIETLFPCAVDADWGVCNGCRIKRACFWRLQPCPACRALRRCGAESNNQIAREIPGLANNPITVLLEMCRPPTSTLYPYPCRPANRLSPPCTRSDRVTIACGAENRMVPKTGSGLAALGAAMYHFPNLLLKSTVPRDKHTKSDLQCRSLKV